MDIKWKADGVLIEKNRDARLVHILLSSVAPILIDSTGYNLIWRFNRIW